MSIMKWSTLGAALLLATLIISVPAQQSTTDARAQEVLREAKKALGGESNLQAISGLSTTWKFTRLAARGDHDTGEFQYDLLLPGTFRKSEVVSLSGNVGQVSTISVLNDEQVWSDVRSSSTEIPIVNASPVKTDESALRQRLQKEFASYVLQILLTTPSTFPVNTTYVGEAEAEDGRADVLEVTGANNLSMRLFFDRETHLLRLASYREAARQKFLAPSSTNTAKPAPSPQKTSEIKPTEVEVQLRFSEFRTRGGVLVPHRVTRERDGKVDLEMELKDLKLNPSFKPEYFKKK
jgi:hypothetical protein